MKCALGILLCAASAAAQNAAPQNAPQTTAGDLAALEQTAKQRHAEWESLAKDLSERMARILPCDPRALAAVTDVSRASDARLAAFSEYLKGVSGQAFAETATAKILLATEERRAVEAGLLRADAGQEQTAVDTQTDGLAQSVRQRASLQDSQKLLEQIAAMVRERVTAADQHAGAADAAVALLRDLVTKFDARDAALREEFAALEAERARWTGYYSARRTRVQTECSITQVVPSPPKSPAQSKSPGPSKSPAAPRGKQ